FSRGWHSSRFNSVAVSRIKRNFRRFSLASFAICHVAQYAGHKQVNTPLFDSWTCKIFRRILATQLQTDRNFMSGGSVFRFARRRCVESSPSLVTLMVSAVLLLVLHQNEPALAADGCPTPGFTAARTFQAGSYPFFVAVGELNSDGKLDLVTANEYSDNVSVLLGRGDGTFQTAVNYNSGRYPQFVAIGDFNGDGKEDIAVANVNSGDVSVLLGNGDGTFQTAVNYALGNYPYAVAVGDFNGDAKPDLAVATGGGVLVLLNNDDGTFRSPMSY